MKTQTASMIKKIGIKLLSALFIVCLMAIPTIMFGQNPGDNPDARPPEVPLDPRMTIILIGMGVTIAMKVFKQRLARLIPS